MTATCGGCQCRWEGMSMAHCAVCHETFGSVVYFDRHRTAGQCAAPETLGLSYNETRRAWTRPGDGPQAAYGGGRGLESTSQDGGG